MTESYLNFIPKDTVIHKTVVHLYYEKKDGKRETLCNKRVDALHAHAWWSRVTCKSCLMSRKDKKR